MKSKQAAGTTRQPFLANHNGMSHPASFLDLVRSLPGISEAEAEIVLGYFHTRQIKAKEHIVSAGEICKQIAYVSKGCFSYYTLLEKGKKSIIHFAFEDWWTGDLESFISRQPATTYWQAIEDAEIVAVSRNDFDALCSESPAFKQLFSRKTQTGYMRAMTKAARDKSETAEEKYLRMLTEYPQIILRVPHYEVAAYLGIAPESLSRIRNKITGK